MDTTEAIYQAVRDSYDKGVADEKARIRTGVTGLSSADEMYEVADMYHAVLAVIDGEASDD